MAYQTDYSRQHPEAVFDEVGRTRKALKIKAVLEHALADPLSGRRVLDVGAGGGRIAERMAQWCRQMVAMDIDAEAVAHASSHYRSDHLHYLVGDAMSLPFPDASFDVVICAHVYEHVPDAAALMREIERVLAVDGVCFFSAGNRFAVREPHYDLPFLSWLPRCLAHRYLQLSGRGRYYYERHLGYPGLRRLVAAFTVEDYTLPVIRDPQRFAATDVLVPGSRRQRWAVRLGRVLYGVLPGYLWVLRKRGSGPCR